MTEANHRIRTWATTRPDDVVVPKSVQEYIDETPVWSDGTPATATPLTKMQWYIWALAASGKFFEGFVVFVAGVALPLLTFEFNLTSLQKGLVSSASLAGILLGASLLGNLSDRLGRKEVFVGEMALFAVFLLGVALSPNLPMLLLCLLFVGVALGCDYPTAHVMISECSPTRLRGRLVLSAFGFQALGAVAGTFVGYIVLSTKTSQTDWRLMYFIAVVPAVLVTVGRLFVVQSPHWLIAKGRVEEARSATRELLARVPAYPSDVELRPTRDPEIEGRVRVRDLFGPRYRRATLFASIPWFLQDLSTYGIGIFTPVIIATTAGGVARPTDPRNIAEVIHNDAIGARGGVLIDLCLLVGVVIAFFLVDGVGRIKLQIVGFIGCALGLSAAAVSSLAGGTTAVVLLFVGVMLFNVMTNVGPNTQTYVIAGEVFPTEVRATGAGLAASFAKVGAVIAAFLFPMLMNKIGTEALLTILVGASFLGALATWKLRIETRGVSLEHL
ncbi:MAG: MFS transporter [Gordonia sp. (in: high G+C Gram-positive bacteria)]|uniref:MFS transporter n=1 Tax=Gordonia sp. (in: high G+C Gram-positive bacteria) TaxID=84139 RepID=UPI0039E6CA73